MIFSMIKEGSKPVLYFRLKLKPLSRCSIFLTSKWIIGVRMNFLFQFKENVLIKIKLNIVNLIGWELLQINEVRDALDIFLMNRRLGTHIYSFCSV